jgi:hypothetical protein
MSEEEEKKKSKFITFFSSSPMSEDYFNFINFFAF